MGEKKAENATSLSKRDGEMGESNEKGCALCFFNGLVLWDSQLAILVLRPYENSEFGRLDRWRSRFAPRELPLSYTSFDQAWYPNTKPDLVRYKVRYGTASGSYGTPIDMIRWHHYPQIPSSA